MTDPVVLDNVELVTSEFQYGEGPRWHDNHLWFSDTFGDAILRVDEKGNLSRVMGFPRPSGLGFLSDGALVGAAFDELRIYRADAHSGHLREIADLSDPGVTMLNDMVVAASDAIYVGRYYDASAGFPVGELLHVTPDGKWRVVAKDLIAPNGMAILPDDETLLVNQSGGENILAFDIEVDGGLSGRRVWASLPGKYPDGICVDAEGAAWIGSFMTNEFLRVLPGGAVTHSHRTSDRWAVAPMLGGSDGKTLFMISADTDLEDRYPRGISSGVLETARVTVPRAGRP